MPQDDGLFGMGIHVSNGGNLTASGILLDQNRTFALGSTKTNTLLSIAASIFRNTQTDEIGQHGEGLVVFDGATATVTMCRAENNNTASAAVYEYIGADLERKQPARLRIDHSAVFRTKKGGAPDPNNNIQVFGDGVVGDGKNELIIDSTIVSDNSRTGLYFHSAFGLVSNCIIWNNASYGLAIQDSSQDVEFSWETSQVGASSSYLFANAHDLPIALAEQVTTNPGDIPVPSPPTVPSVLH